MTITPVRIGVVGCGSVLDQYLALVERLRNRRRAEVVLACGRPHQRAAAEGLGISRYTTDFAEVVRAPDVDLVLILTSPRDHARIARAALEAGKHVLVEKPMATTLAEAAELVALAKRSTGHLLCAPFTLLSPTFGAIARRLRRGDIGKVASARGRYGWSGPWWNKWFYGPEGGALGDLGVYNLTTLTGLLGPARKVTALMNVAVPERVVNGERLHVEAEDNAHVLLEFANGAIAHVLAGYTIQQYRSPALELYGTEGVIQMLGDDWDPDGYELWENKAGSWQLFKETAPDWPWMDGLRHLVECIQDCTAPLITPEHAYHVLEVIAKAKAAARDGRALAVESTFSAPVFPEPQAEGAAHLVHDRTRATDGPGH